MYFLNVLYPAPAGSHFDWDYYVQTHVPLAHRLLDPQGLVRIEIAKGVSGFPPGTPPAYVAVARLYFRTREELVNALSVSAGTLIDDVANYTDVQPVVQISEVVE